MLEVLLIMSIIYACLLMPLRGKTMQQLTPAQQERVIKNYQRYMKTRKGKQTPNMQIEEYLPILQKQAMTYVIMAIVIVPIYIYVLFNYYAIF